MGKRIIYAIGQPFIVSVRDGWVPYKELLMMPISIVIIAKNKAATIAGCLSRAALISRDIVLVDNGSTDATLNLAAGYGCTIYNSKWQGYGANKNKGIELARHDWILSIDADELPDSEIIRELQQFNPGGDDVVYDLKFRSYFGIKRVNFGNWGRDHHIRLFNRKLVKWTEPKVHETLIIPGNIKRKRLNGYIHHYSVKDAAECNSKAVLYAKLSAEQYFINGRRANIVNLYLSPVFVFLKNYIFLLGFLDGKEGWQISASTFKNRWIKYRYLNYLGEKSGKENPYVKNSFVVNY